MCGKFYLKQATDFYIAELSRVFLERPSYIHDVLDNI